MRLRLLLAVEQLRRAVPGGIGTYARGLVKGLDELGDEGPETTLYASRHRGPVDPLGSTGHQLLSAPLPGAALTRAWARGLLSAPEGFDVVHSVSLSAPPRGQAPLSLMVHDLAWRDLPTAFPRRGRRWHEAALQRALRHADLIIAPSTLTADALVNAGAGPERVEVVEEGSDLLPPPDTATAERLLASLGVTGPYLLAVGTLEPRKNLRTLVGAYRRARPALPDPWPLVVVGPRGWGHELEPAAGVVLAGRVEDPVLAALYAGARCLAYVPLVEGFGLPVVEAMAVGVPVVASPIPSAGGATLEVPPSDVAAIASALTTAASDERARADLVSAGRARVAGLTWQAAARRHLALWTALANGGYSRHGAPRGARRPAGTTSLRLARPTVSRGRDGRVSVIGPVPVTSGGAETEPAVALALDVSAVPERPAGAGRYTLDLAAALARRPDVSLTLLARSADAGRWSQVAPDARIEAVAPGPRPMRLAWEQAALPGLLARLPVDVNHSPHYTMPLRARLPRVVTIHDLTFFDHPEWHEKVKVPVFRRAIAMAARKADAIVCVSEATARRLVGRFDPEAPVFVAHHGVDRERFCPEAAAGDELARRALGVAAPYVVFIGTIEPRKDVPTLLRAFDRMCSAHPGLTLVLAGLPGWGSAAADAVLSSMKHADRVQRVGYITDEAAPALLRGAVAVAYPSLDEGFGLPALEALACGAPLVTTTGSAMEEIAEGAALLVRPGDVEALAGALDMLARGDEGLAPRRVRGIEIASRSTWEASAEVHLSAYRAAVARAPAR